MKYKSEIFEVIHQDAAANYDIGAISKAEMKKFDKMCLIKERESFNFRHIFPLHYFRDAL
jgi:DNA-binding transcriptional regulator YiaG